MRRLPVYLVLDTSGSMFGEPIEAVRNGLQTLVAALRQDPHALESAVLSVIGFSDKAQQLIPLTELASFQIPSINAAGSTAMGAALSLLADCIGKEVRLSSAEVKGDWKPIVFLMTDGETTDDLNPGLEALKKTKFASLIACAAGPNANTAQLSQIPDTVLKLDTADSHSIKAFFKWVSASIATTSQKVDLQKKETTGLSDLPPPPPEVNVVL